MSACIVLVTAPDETVAKKIAEALVHEWLAACVSMIPNVYSVYRWKEAMERAFEVQLVIKTTEERIAEIKARVRTLHPYEMPEILVLPVTGGSTAYLDWIRQSTD